MDFGHSHNFSEFHEAMSHAPQFSLRNVIPYYQPIYDDEFQLRGFEALARLKHGTKILSPSQFLEGLSEGERSALDLHMLKKACAFLQSADGIHGPVSQELFVGVNITPEFLAEGNAAQRILSTMRHYGVEPSQIKLELIERPFLTSINRIESELILLKKHGVHIVLDDYTTGASTPERLTQLWDYVRGIKLPREFLLYSKQSRDDVLRTIPYNVEVTLEGAETPAHMHEARTNDIQLLQGYGLNRPLDACAALSIIGAPLAMDVDSHEPVFVGHPALS